MAAAQVVTDQIGWITLEWIRGLRLGWGGAPRCEPGLARCAARKERLEALLAFWARSPLGDATCRLGAVGSIENQAFCSA